MHADCRWFVPEVPESTGTPNNAFRIVHGASLGSMYPETPPSLSSLLISPHIPQRAFSWPRQRWTTWLAGIEGVPELLESLPNAVDRYSTATVIEYQIRQGFTPEAFVASQVWGHGHSGYGPYRCACILSGSREPHGKPVDPTVVDKLSTSVERLNAEGPVEAYRYLNNGGHIAGLGPAFFTKWLYFVSAGHNNPYGEQAAPVLDEIVTAWLREHASTFLRYAKTDDYAKYLDLLEHWGKRYGRTRVQVEEAIFRLIRHDGTHPDQAPNDGPTTC